MWAILGWCYETFNFIMYFHDYATREKAFPFFESLNLVKPVCQNHYKHESTWTFTNQTDKHSFLDGTK